MHILTYSYISLHIPTYSYVFLQIQTYSYRFLHILTRWWLCMLLDSCALHMYVCALSSMPVAWASRFSSAFSEKGCAGSRKPTHAVAAMADARGGRDDLSVLLSICPPACSA